jgi:two-component system chemotaxis response regulator CheY
MAKKILIIDDSEVLRKIIVFNLKKLGYEIEEAIDGITGLEKLRSFSPDVTILDIMMPRMDGFGVLKEKANDDAIRHIPVIVLTAKGGEDDRDTALSMGAHEVMTKPFSPKQLIECVDKVIQNA